MPVSDEILNSQRRNDLSDFLTRVAEQLDVPAALQRRADEEYEYVARFIQADSEARERVSSELYSQGSRRLGTATWPVSDDHEFDFDFVYERYVQKAHTSQAALKRTVGDQLRRYLEDRRRSGLYVPVLEPKRRCWTLHFDGHEIGGIGFHMDVLPAIPDEEGAANAILITDRQLTRWQHSNPKDYSEWFFSQMRVAELDQRAILAKEAKVDIEQVREWRVRTPLQRAVQLLKRHRDLRFAGNPDDKPISIIITTLAARAYDNQADLLTTLQEVVRGMRDHIELRDGVYWVPNPVNDDENFADKWAEFPNRADEFFAWLDQVEADVELAMNKRGIDELTRSLQPHFGSIVTKAAAAMGHAVLKQRTAGALKVSPATGLISAAAGIPLRPHTFHGNVD